LDTGKNRNEKRCPFDEKMKINAILLLAFLIMGFALNAQDQPGNKQKR